MARLADHYEAVRDRHGYDEVDVALGDIGPGALRRRFVAVDGREAVAAALERPTMVCTGVGMTGPPHLGTVGQLLTAVELQAAGLEVQLVIADLEPYHGGADLERVTALAERYRAFAQDLGFDPGQGALRTQSAARDVMHTGHRLARHYRPEVWSDPTDGEQTAWERAVADHYGGADAGADEGTDAGDGSGDGDGDGDGNGGPTSPAADHHSAVLHGADFLHPLYAEGYEQVIVALGIDEHGLTPWTRRFRDAAPVEGAVAGLHTRMVPGFDAPKMSKSTGAGVSLAADPEDVRAALRGAEGGRPSESPVFAAMCLASRYGGDRLDRLETACREGGAVWERATREYADYAATLAERWRATAD